MSNYFFSLILLILAIGFPNVSQRRVKEILVDGGCNYIGHIEGQQKIYTFGSTDEAEQVVDRIVKHSGIVRNFEILAADVENAQAVIESDGKRYIYYNQEFMARVRNTTGTNWAEVSIIAHEIGHHLNGHTLEAGGSRPPIELEADQYSGFVLRFMNSSLAEAQAAMNSVASDNGSATHPPKRSRLAAIRYGWTQADALLRPNSGTTIPAKPQPTPTTPQKLEIHAENVATEVQRGWWNWTVYIEGPAEALEQIRCVEYTLHPTFTPSVTEVCERGTGRAFALTREGWGTFRIEIRIFLKNGQILKTYHDLRFS